MKWVIASAVVLLLAHTTATQRILNDSRDHPAEDGSFGFAYNTEDGIRHIAQGVPGGAVHGVFSYTDPTGLKVNYNYNAGRQALFDPKPAPGRLPDEGPVYMPPPPPPPQQIRPAPVPRYQPPPQQPSYIPRYTGPNNNQNSVYDYNTNY